MDLAKRGNWLVQFNSESSPPCFQESGKKSQPLRNGAEVLRRLELSV
jgi:hypothetical protein